MLVDLMDGQCRTCGCQLAIVDASEASMTVLCVECDDSYVVEPDAFRDGYYPAFRARQRAQGVRR
jgi:hypothetical protein